MNHLLRGLVFASLVPLSVAVLTGCPKKGGDAADAEAEAAAVAAPVATPAAPVLPTATNENAVSRFPDEKKLDNVTATIQRPTNVREIPGIGKIVATLAKGGTVTEIASRNNFFLVIFTNPADQKALMGWLPADSFTAAAVVPIAPIKCTVPETALIGDAPFCGKICTADTDCPSGQACKGAANKLLAAGGRGDAVTVCTVFGRVAAPPPPVAVVTPPGPVFGLKDTPPANIAVVTPKDGKCPVGFAIIRDGQCHRICGACPASAPFCINCKGPNVCSANKDLCN